MHVAEDKVIWQSQAVLQTQLRCVLWKISRTYHIYPQDDHASDRVCMWSRYFPLLGSLVLLLNSLGAISTCHLFLYSLRGRSVQFQRIVTTIRMRPWEARLCSLCMQDRKDNLDNTTQFWGSGHCYGIRFPRGHLCAISECSAARILYAFLERNAGWGLYRVSAGKRGWWWLQKQSTQFWEVGWS